MSELLNDELVVFVGHSDDARAEADSIKSLETALQAELKSKTELVEEPPFKSVKVWEWSRDAGGRTGGQAELIDPVIDGAHFGVFRIQGAGRPDHADRAGPLPGKPKGADLRDLSGSTA